MATMRLPVDSELLTQFLPLESIVCSPLDGSPLRLISASELLARLPAADCSRVSDEVVGAFVSDGELKNLDIPRGVGETALRYPPELVDAFMVEWAAKKLANAK